MRDTNLYEFLALIDAIREDGPENVKSPFAS